MLNRKKKIYVFLAMFLTSIFICSPVFSEPPLLINYQGRLTDNGNLADGSYDMRFYIGTLVDMTSWELFVHWDEIQTVLVNDGIFNVQLGAVTTLPPNIFSLGDLYLQVAINSGGTGDYEVLTPMHRLTSVPFAIRAAQAAHADEVDGIGSDGQLNYNDNGTMAGAPIFYNKTYNHTTYHGAVWMRDGFLSVIGSGLQLYYDHPDTGHEGIYFSTNKEDTRLVHTEEGSTANLMKFFHDKVTFYGDIKIGIGTENPLATLDLNGYAKLKPYSTAPVSCTQAAYGSIAMNSYYDLCVCRPYNLTKEWRKVADITQICW